MPGPTFSTALKTSSDYLDVAANTHGEEKAFLMLEALRRIRHHSPHLVEVGPGGGSAIAYLASQFSSIPLPDDVRLTLVEAPGVTSVALDEAMHAFNRAATCRLVTGFAQDIGTVLTEPADVISASALLHEVYSHGGGYRGLHAMIRTVPTVLRPGGMFAYRDVYAVKGASLHDRVMQTYASRSWLRFLRMFLPQYLREGTHPYHSDSDLVVLRQDSRIVPLEHLDERTSAVAAGPVGIFR
ncbi:class I SAM-dependent methyltransferase [Streptomyces carpaticus]|nr:class I SAM-dependent methyltransferase [Streptomyces carpaticus]